MIDTINTDATQDNARALNNLFAGKQVVNSRDLDLPARSVAFTDGTHVTIQAATALPNGTRLNANGLTMDSDNLTNDDDDYYKGKIRQRLHHPRLGRNHERVHRHQRHERPAS